jgi:hypothetical protein
MILSTNAKSSLSAITKSKRRRANALLVRWALITREGIPDLGYKHNSPEQERVPGIDCCKITQEKVLPEDEAVIALVKKMHPKTRELVYEKWRYRAEDKTLMHLFSFTEKQLESRINAIKDHIADSVLY